MEQKKENTTSMHIEAGEVILIEYTGEKKPCDKVLALLLHPITMEEGKYIGSLTLLYSFDTEKEEFLPQCAVNDVTMRINVVTKDVKAWYFEQVMAMLERIRKEAKQ